MRLEITPEPTPEERKAIERALAALERQPADPRGPWWREGLREWAVADQDEPESPGVA